MKKTLVVFVVLLFALFAGCSQRSPELSHLQLIPVQEEAETAPGQHHLNGQYPAEEPQELLEGSGEMQVEVVRSPFGEGERLVALTFDDGPSHHTDRILDLLEEHGGAATFFVLGYRIENHRSTIKRAVQMGSEVAGHSWNHADFSLLTEEEIEQQIRDSSEAVAQFTEEPPRIFRPPFGRTNETVRRVSEELGYAIINWTVDTRDWEHRDADHIYDHIMSTVQSGDIVLMHDIYATTLEAVERAIPRLIEEGYRLVTVSELLLHLHGELEPGTVYGKDYDVPLV